MKKIPTYFERDWDGDRSRVIDKVTPGCEWVLNGEGAAYRKLDGTCCLVRDGKLFKRREVKSGKTDPQGFILSEQDETTGKRVGWVEVGDDPQDRWHREAFDLDSNLLDGTYELVGPKVQGGAEPDVWSGLGRHVLFKHDHPALLLAEANPPQRSFEYLRHVLDGVDIEGIVFHHPDGRMAKIKLRDFGLVRGDREGERT